MILLIAQCVWDLTKGIWNFAFFSYPTTKGFWVEFWVGMKLRHTCITYFDKSKTGPQGDASHTLWSRRASVWNFYNFLILNIFGTTWIMTLSLFNECLLFESMGYLSFFLSFFSFLHALWYAFFSLMPFGLDISFFSLLF